MQRHETTRAGAAPATVSGSYRPLAQMRRIALVTFAATCIVVVAIVVAASLAMRAQEIGNAERRAVALAAQVDEQVTGAIAALDLVLKLAQQAIAEDGDADAPGLRRLMAIVTEGPFDAEGFVLTDGEGAPVFSTLPAEDDRAVVERIDAAGRVDATVERPSIVPHARHSGKGVEGLIAFRHIVAADARPLGHVAALVSAEKVRRQLAGIVGNGGWTLRLFLDDGTAIATASRDPEPAEPLSPLGLGNGDLADGALRYVLDEKRHISAVTPVAGLPLYVSASIPADTVLIHWRQQSVQLFLVMLLLLGALGCSLALMYRHRREGAEQARMLALQGAAMNAAANAIVITDRDGRVEWANAAFERLTGYALDDVKGKMPRFLQLGPHNASFHAELWSTVRDGRVWRGELRDRARGEGFYEVQQTVTPITEPDGNLSHLIAVHEDIGDRKAAERELYRLANFDVLTGLPNRLLMRDRLERAIALARRRGTSVGVLLLDLDHFKDVNDTLGHPLGDELLSAVARRIFDAVRRSDTVARLGGDEFVILMPDADEAMASVIAERILAFAGAPFDVQGHALHVTGSVGMAFFPTDGDDVDTLMRHADLAMYAAKAAGRGRMCRYVPELAERAEERRSIESKLKSAINRGELQVVYQPQVEIGSGRVIGAEALVRWHPDGGEPIPPERFIPIAESTGQILAIDEWVAETAARDAAAWRADGALDLRVSVNVSALHLHRTGFAASFMAILERAGLPPSAFAIELTETAFLAPTNESESQLARLRDIGIFVDLDDFGTGYSSLSYLRRLPISRLKIDRGFVGGLGRDPGDEAIVSGIVNLGRAFGLGVVAEGAETDAQLEHLRRIGCDVAQGWAVARPMSAADFSGWLAGRRAR